ncbi:MAG: poly-gamma-glutamate hydrolase family protein [Gammaproteobacteria bacterium]
MPDKYKNFAELAKHERLNKDYQITVQRRAGSNIAVVAPHGGSIERRTSEIARSIAGTEHNLYLFEGQDPLGTFDTLHITSHRFDEPKCLSLIASIGTVVTIHGCSGKDKFVYLGGLDTDLKTTISKVIEALGIRVDTHAHQFQGRHTKNICNRGGTGKGVQIELSDGLRGAPEEALISNTIRDVLRRLSRS